MIVVEGRPRAELDAHVAHDSGVAVEPALHMGRRFMIVRLDARVNRRSAGPEVEQVHSGSLALYMRPETLEALLAAYQAAQEGRRP